MARGRWLKKNFGKYASKVGDMVKEQASEQVGSMDASQFGPAVEKIQDMAKRCFESSAATMEVCEQTTEKRQLMIDFGNEITSTLSNLKNQEGDASSILETIKDLTDGDKVRAASELAKGLDEAAITCVNKSIEMIDTIEDGMDSLPQVVQDAIESQHEESGDDDPEALLRDVENDVLDVQKCIESIKQLHLTTALKVGLEAFEQLTDKAKRSRSMFDSIKGFAGNVKDISGAMMEMDVMAVATKGKDLLRCIHLCESMRKLSEGAGKLIKIIIDLFKQTADRISALWSALAFAKDCMLDCLDHVNKAKSLCTDAKDRSMTLISKTELIKERLAAVGKININSIGAVRELSQGGEIEEAIDLAKSMDDVVLETSSKVTDMVNRVSEGFGGLPDILVEGIDLSTAGKREGDPEPVHVESDIAELEESTRAIDEADIVSAAQAGVRGFSGVSSKASVCKDTLTRVEKFAGDASGTIDSFMSVWDLESAATKIEEMCRLVNLGEMIKQLATEIKKLLLAMVGLMKAAVAKFSGDFPDVMENIGDAVGDAVGSAVDTVKDKMKAKLKFW